MTTVTFVICQGHQRRKLDPQWKENFNVGNSIRNDPAGCCNSNSTCRLPLCGTFHALKHPQLILLSCLSHLPVSFLSLEAFLLHQLKEATGAFLGVICLHRLMYFNKVTSNPVLTKKKMTAGRAKRNSCWAVSSALSSPQMLDGYPAFG